MLLAPVPDNSGRVFVGGPQQARGRTFRVVFVPGLAERMFPQHPHEDPLLLDAEMRAPLRADAGADLVIGGHPHWVQGWEMAGSAVVVHSLGNFVFDMDFQTKTREGIFLEIGLWGDTVKAVEPGPYVIDADFTPRLTRGARAERILGDVWQTSRGPFALTS